MEADYEYSIFEKPLTPYHVPSKLDAADCLIRYEEF
jgi:hypothetical protein